MTTLTLRLPDDVHAAVTALAAIERRSMNTVMLIALERYLASQKPAVRAMVRDRVEGKGE